MSAKLRSFIKSAPVIAGLIISGAGVASAADTDIHGNWIVERIQGHRTKGETRSTLDIADDNKISGTGGCNRYMGSMEIKGDRIRVLPAGATMMACPPEIMKQDARFHAALRLVTSWKIKRNHLILTDAQNREVLRLKRG